MTTYYEAPNAWETMRKTNRKSRRIQALAIGVCLFASALSKAQTAPAPAAESPTVSAPPNQPTTPGITGSWAGERNHLVDDGLTVAAGVYFDTSKNFQGGISTSNYACREFFDLDITFTTDQVLHWHGGTFFLNFLDHEGTDATQSLVGDAQGFDNQDGPRSSQIYQLFFQQLLASDKVRFKIGRIDATTDFAFTANGSAFLGSSFGYSPAITSFPTYPDPAIGAALFWTPTENLYASGGIDYANRSDRSLILSGSPYTARLSSGGLFLIAELGAKWTLGSDKLTGRLGVGGYTNTGTLQRFDQTNQHGATGMYAVFDQTLWQIQSSDKNSTTPPTGAGVFGQYGLADANISTINQHIGAGLQWTGPIPLASRATDVVGIGTSYVHFSNQAKLARDHEIAMETFYKLQLTPWFNLQPDLQYITNPGGRAGHDAVIGTLRAELDF